MNIGSYSFEEFKERAASFHGYPAPGLLIGGYMVAMAKRSLPKDTLFEAVVETSKCLPDAVQLLSFCSVGNNWMKVINLGKYAVSLYDKYTGEGFRVHLDVSKFGPYPEIHGWFLKKRPKSEQDSEQLFQEIRKAGDTICTIMPIRVNQGFLGHSHMSHIGVCPNCGEAFPSEDGILCRGCQGEAPTTPLTSELHIIRKAPRVVPVEEAVGKNTLHDMTEIIPGTSKGAVFSAGQKLNIGDVCRLQQMGRFSIAVEDNETPNGVHENEGAQAFAKRMAGTGVEFSLPPKEGKITFTAQEDGLLCLNRKILEAFNMLPDVMCATRHDATLVKKGAEIGGTRVIPLYINPQLFGKALQILSEPLLSVAPLRKANVGILVTGTEVFKGLIKDSFIPIISKKVKNYGAKVVKSVIVADEADAIAKALAEIKAAKADLLITTGGLSVDPDDITRQALLENGLSNILYGAPVLPGTMSLMGRMVSGDAAPLPTKADCGLALPLHQPAKGEMQVLGVPACALYFKTTLFDTLLPRILAGRIITRAELARMAEGGFCTNCQRCTWPKCWFLK